ncbi:MAG: PHP-associated domain-containing protein [Candidatus Hermodarchaeota archaeon]
MEPIKLDLHIHTIYSGDALITPKNVLKYAKIKGLDGFAITDHDTLKAYNILKSHNKDENLIIIPGMEIKTHIGEIIALFIDEEIDIRDNDFFTIIDKVRDNNGLVVVPHPFDFLRDNRLKLKLLSDKTVRKHIDGIEILNSRIIFKSCVKKAKKFNEKYNLFETGGSDAHTKTEIGTAYTTINGANDGSLESIRKSLLSRNSKSEGKLSPSYVHLITVLNKIKKGLYT